MRKTGFCSYSLHISAQSLFTHQYHFLISKSKQGCNFEIQIPIFALLAITKMEENDSMREEIARLAAEIATLREEKQQLLDNSLLMGEMLDNFNGCIWYIDTNYRLGGFNQVFANEMQEVYGYIPVKGSAIFGPLVWDGPEVLFWKKWYDQVFHTSQALTFTLPFKTLKGKEMHECQLFPAFTNEGKIKGIFGYKKDITPKWRAEEENRLVQAQFSHAQQIARMGTWIAFPQEDSMWLSKEMQQMIELDPPYVSTLKMKLSEYQNTFVHPDSNHIFSEGLLSLKNNIDNIGYEDKYEYILHSAKGNQRIIFVKRKVIAKGKVEGLSQDITEFRTIERENVQLTADLMQKVSAAEQFTYIVSHNLRSPVARLLGLTTILDTKDAQLSTHNIFVIDNIQKVASQLDTVITDLNAILALKKETDEQMTTIPLRILLDDITEFLRNDIDASAIKIHLQIAEDVTLHAIPSYAHSIFTNFLTNAIKYKSPDRKPEVHITTTTTHSFLCVSVTDNGIGMDMQKVKSRLFSPFSRFHTRQKTDGKGLGLFLVKSQLEIMGGKIEVESTPNVGTTFRVFFRIP